MKLPTTFSPLFTLQKDKYVKKKSRKNYNARIHKSHAKFLGERDLGRTQIKAGDVRARAEEGEERLVVSDGGCHSDDNDKVASAPARRCI